MDTQVTKSSNSPLAWTAGIAVILFSGMGIGAIMGWIPTSMGHTAEAPVAEKTVITTNAKPAAPKPHTAPVQVANNTHTNTRCAECGVVESTREIKQKGEGSGIGVVG